MSRWLAVVVFLCGSTVFAEAGMRIGGANRRLLVIAVVDGGPAAKAGLKAGDRIIQLGAEPAASTPGQLAQILAADLERLEPIVKRTGARLE